MLEFVEPDGIPARGTVIVIPGRGEQPEVYRRFGSRIAADAYRVQIISDPAAEPDSARGQLRDLIAAAGPRPVVLAGSDSGATFAVALLSGDETGDVDGLIVAGLPAQAGAAAPASWEDELEARTTCPTHRGRIASEIVTRGALYGAVPEQWLEDGDLAEITVPILALHGQDDPVSSLEVMRERYLTAPQIELVSVVSARHDVLNDQSHRSVAATIVLWLERLKRNGPELSAITVPEPGRVKVA